MDIGDAPRIRHIVDRAIRHVRNGLVVLGSLPPLDKRGEIMMKRARRWMVGALTALALVPLGGAVAGAATPHYHGPGTLW